MHKPQQITCQCGSTRWAAYISESFGTTWGDAVRKRDGLIFACDKCKIVVVEGDADFAEVYPLLRDQWFLTQAPQSATPTEWAGRCISINGEIEAAKRTTDGVGLEEPLSADQYPFVMDDGEFTIQDPTLSPCMRESVDAEAEYGVAFAKSVFANPKNFEWDRSEVTDADDTDSDDEE